MTLVTGPGERERCMVAGCKRPVAWLLRGAGWDDYAYVCDEDLEAELRAGDTGRARRRPGVVPSANLASPLGKSAHQGTGTAAGSSNRSDFRFLSREGCGFDSRRSHRTYAGLGSSSGPLFPSDFPSVAATAEESAASAARR